MYCIIYVQINTLSTSTRQTVISQHEKFREAKSIVNKLPSLAFEVEFSERMEVLEQLLDIWACGGKAIVNEDKELMDENVFDDNEGKRQVMINVILLFKSENLEELCQLCVDDTEIQDSTQGTHDVKNYLV